MTNPTTAAGGRWWKKILVFSALAVAVTLSSSLLYGYPLNLDFRWRLDSRSADPARPSGDLPDNVVLTPAFDLGTAVTVTWRTSERVEAGVVQYVKADAPEGTAYRERKAESTTLTAEELRSDRTVNCHTAILTGLTSGTAYRYRVGNRTLDLWSEFRTFTTAPGEGEPFSFVYFGDTQVDSGQFGNFLDTVERRHPETLFYMIGGDLVDEGVFRNQWDDFVGTPGISFRGSRWRRRWATTISPTASPGRAGSTLISGLPPPGTGIRPTTATTASAAAACSSWC